MPGGNLPVHPGQKEGVREENGGVRSTEGLRDGRVQVCLGTGEHCTIVSAHSQNVAVELKFSFFFYWLCI